MGGRYSDPGRRSQHAGFKSESAVQIAWYASRSVLTFSKLTSYRPISGCKIEKLTKKELARRRLPESEANTKRAHLTIPLEFPKARVKRRN